MPELPEVEVTRLGLESTLLGQRFSEVIVRERRFRQPVPVRRLSRCLVGRSVRALRRRSKYLLIDVEGDSTLIVHLGMSGRLRLLDRACQPEAHEHVVFELESGKDLRFCDPRRFGLVLLEPTHGLQQHPLFSHLGPEPLLEEFDQDHLFRRSRRRKAPIKNFLMDARVVVGVGNIYACEALFRAGIDPRTAAGRISRVRLRRLRRCVREVLAEAIEQGGTTLKDFANTDGEPGYFKVKLAAYGRAGEPCARCAGKIRRIVQSNRATFFCSACQR